MLICSQAGDWNFSSLGGGPRPAAGPVTEPGPATSGARISIGRLRVTGGRVTLVRAGSRLKPSIYEKIELSARNLALDSEFPFQMTAVLPGEGSVKLDGNAGPVHRADTAQTPLQAAVAIKRFDLVRSGFVEPGSGLGGVIDFDGTFKSDGKQGHTLGRARLEKLQLVKGGSPSVQTVSVAYALDHDLKAQSGTLGDTVIECGKAAAHLTGGYRMSRDLLVLSVKIRGGSMPLADVQSLLPAAGLFLPKGASLQGGALNIDLTVDGPIEKITTAGTVDIARTRLTGFDLGNKMSTVASLVGIKASPETEIEKFFSAIRITPEETRFSNLELIVPSLGQLLGGGTIDSRHTLDFKMLARLKTASGIAGTLVRLSGDNGLGVSFSIRGTTADPSFSADVKGAAGNLLDSVKGSSAGTPERLWRALIGTKKK
jgi:AsmA protein